MDTKERNIEIIRRLEDVIQKLTKSGYTDSLTEIQRAKFLEMAEEIKRLSLETNEELKLQSLKLIWTNFLSQVNSFLDLNPSNK